MILLFGIVQIVFNFIGINLFNSRIQFESKSFNRIDLIFNGFAAVLLVWFILAKWPKEYIWLIWGFLW